MENVKPNLLWTETRWSRGSEFEEWNQIEGGSLGLQEIRTSEAEGEKKKKEGE